MVLYSLDNIEFVVLLKQPVIWVEDRVVWTFFVLVMLYSYKSPEENIGDGVGLMNPRRYF
jgi:hypothetical protein